MTLSKDQAIEQAEMAQNKKVNNWSEKAIQFTVSDGKLIEKSPIKAKDLLPLLEKSNAYGIEKFKSLINF